MKELSIEEKAARYDEAVKRIENIKTGKCETTFMFTEGLFEHIFPELAESEDEKIRKELIGYFTGWSNKRLFRGFKAERILAWIEKQGEQKLAWSEKDEEMVEGLVNCLDELEKENGWNYVYVVGKSVEFNKVRKWVKSLKERYTWKPSDAQMKAIQESIGIVGELTPRGECLKELEEQLKKLKG